MCEHPGQGNNDDSQEPYLPGDGEENSGYRVTLTNEQIVHAIPRIDLPEHIQEGLRREMKYLGFRVDYNRLTSIVTIKKNNNQVIAKLINDGKLLYALDRVPA